jgi:O-antigen/teichoic acid export membrane protein
MIYKFSRPSFRLLDVKLCNAMLKQALPFALGGVLSIVYFRIDGLVLKYIMGPDGDLAMGWYGTGYSLVNALTIIPGAFMGAVFPVMSRIIIKNVKLKDSMTSAIDFLYTKSFKLMFTIALPIAVGMSFLANRIVLILYPTGRFTLQDQEALIWILRILIWSGALIFLNTVLITVFRAANKRRAFLVIMAVVVFVNIGFNLFLIPGYGHIGPAISMVISESLLFASGLWYVQSHVCKLSEFGFLFKTVFASGFLALGLFFWEYAPGFGRDIHIALTVCISAILYFAVILALKGLEREDIALVKGRFQGSVDFE